MKLMSVEPRLLWRYSQIKSNSWESHLWSRRSIWKLYVLNRNTWNHIRLFSALNNSTSVDTTFKQPTNIIYILRAELYFSLSPDLLPVISLFIYIYILSSTDCFVISQLFSVARQVGHMKLGSKPTQLYVRLSIRPLGQQAYHVS